MPLWPSFFLGRRITCRSDGPRSSDDSRVALFNVVCVVFSVVSSLWSGWCRSLVLGCSSAVALKIWTTYARTTLLKNSRRSVTGVGIFRASDPCGCGERILVPGSDGQVHYDVHGLLSAVADHGNELRRHEPDHYVDRYWQTPV